jgi:hypothetical protein
MSKNRARENEPNYALATIFGKRLNLMNEVLTDLSFEAWVRHLFCQPGTDPSWHWVIDADRAELEPNQVLAYAARLFADAGVLLAPYADGQVNHGLWFLIDEGGSPLYALAEKSIPLERRLICIQSIPALFERCFAPRCTAHLSHLDEPGAGPLNPVCYMWWDIFPLYGQPGDPARGEIDSACLSVMETTLRLPSLACQESALHGLGHWGHYYKSRCVSIISAYLERNANLPPALRVYAERARRQDVL